MKKTIAIIILTAIITAGLTLGGIFMFARHGGDDTQATTDDAIPAGRISSDTKSGSVVTCAHAYRENVYEADEYVIMRCVECGDEQKVNYCIDWWLPCSQEEQRFVGIWYLADGSTALALNDNATFVLFKQLYTDSVGTVRYRTSESGYWYLWDNQCRLRFAEQRKLRYEPGEYTDFTVQSFDGETLCLAAASDTFDSLYGREFVLHRGSREPFYDNMGDGEEDTFCTATFLFSLDAPERISAASLDQAGYLTVLVRSTIVSGGYAWVGSSTDLGASIIISDKDGNVLIEAPRCCTDDYTYNVKRTGDVIISEHRFYAKDQPGGSFAPGEYDITVLHYGQSELYSSRLTVTE